MIELSGAALLEVATATAANKQSVAGKNHGLIGCDIAHAAVRMAGRRERTQRDTPDAELLAIVQWQVNMFRPNSFCRSNPAAGQLFRSEEHTSELQSRGDL